MKPRTAGLALSVGSASFPVRCFLAAMFGLVGLLCLAAAILLGRIGPTIATVIAILAIVPLGCISGIGAAFALAPFSRFGVWLDVFVGGLTWTRLALVFAGFWAFGALLVFAAHR